jgi:hypothetical protein
MAETEERPLAALSYEEIMTLRGKIGPGVVYAELDDELGHRAVMEDYAADVKNDKH